MGTRAQAFTAKIKNLQEIQVRLMQGSLPLPQGHEIANSLKYFSSTLLNVLKDVPGQPMVKIRCRDSDTERLGLFPSLDYKGLYSTLLQFLDIVDLLPNGLYDFGKALLVTLCSLVPFLERELIDTLPYVVASTLISFPSSLVEDVVDVLCHNLLPFTITNSNHPVDNCVLPEENLDFKRSNYAFDSAPSILMMVFQFVKDNSAIHRKITETLMALKEDVTKDLLCVIAHGTPDAKGPAANLLFYYWPNLNPTHYDRRTVLTKFNSSPTWTPPICQNPECSSGNAGAPGEAVKVCLDHTISLAHKPEIPPPSFCCNDCYTQLVRQSNSAKAHELFEDINHPITEVDTTCENKNCRSAEKMAVVWCFSRECTTYNGNRPVRLCSQCNKIRHNTRRGADHVTHNSLPSPWEMEAETQNYLVKAVVGLLQEAVPFGSGKSRDQEEAHRRTLQVLSSHEEADSEEANETILNERRLLSRYGVWLLVGLSTPNKDTTPSTFGHMLSMLFQWFNATAYLPNDKTGTALEKLKSEYLPEWLKSIYDTHGEIFVNCLLPNPPDYAKVGGHWDIITTRTNHIKEGLVRFFCLVPYDVISLEVWNKAMSHWMQAINQEVPKDELVELQTVFCKIFDPDMSPLGFDAKEMYQFISERFNQNSIEVLRQALQWLQLLCLLNIPIPIEILFDMFNSGIETTLNAGPAVAPTEEPEDVNEEDENKEVEGKPKLIVEVRSGGCVNPDDICSLARPLSSFSSGGALIETVDEQLHLNEQQQQHQEHQSTKEEIFLTCFNLIIDVLNGQLELQDVELHSGLNGPYAPEILSLVNKIVSTKWLSELSNCLEEAAYLNSLSETNEGSEEVTIIEELLIDLLQLVHGTIKKLIPPEDSQDEDGNNEDSNNTLTASGSSMGDTNKDNKKAKTPGLSQFMAVLTTMQSTVEKPQTMEESDSESSQDGCEEDFDTSVIEEYSVPLQLIYHLLVRNSELSDADMRYYLLGSLHALCIQCDVLSSGAKKHKKFLRWCQESLLTGHLWQLLESTHSQVAQVAVPLLMHSVGLPGGADVLWKALDADFQSDDWRTRFAAVERVTVIFRFLPEKMGNRNTNSVKSVLSHAFCCLIACMEDLTPQVSQQANLFLGTIHDSSIRTLIQCLEYQFDNIPIDRPVILKRLYQLFNCLIDRKILTWNFFVSRFEVLINEVQNYNTHQKHIQESILLLKREDSPPDNFGINGVADDSIGEPGCSNGGRKKHPTTETVRSLSANLKFPYKRTISAPGGMGLSAKSAAPPTHPSSVPNNPSHHVTTTNRQVSAPILKNTNKMTKEHSLSKQVSNVATVIDELECTNIAAKTSDLEEVDKETIHFLVFLFMQYLSHPDQAGKSNAHDDENSSGKNKDDQHHMSGALLGHSFGKASEKAFQNLYTLIGFNENERRFTTMPYRIRCTPAINAFISNLPQLLDNNFAVGRFMLLNVILILQKIPFPPRYATAWQPAYTLMQEKYLFQGCGFSLWHLEPTMRKNWLSAVMVIAYKYKYGGQHDEASAIVGEKVVGLIRILIHTLAAQAHVCDRHAKPVTGLTMRSRDLSSLGGETDQNLPDNDTVFDVEHGEVNEEEADDDEDSEDEFEMEDEGDELLRNKNNDSGLTNVTKAKIETRNSNPTSSGLPPLPPDWSMQRLPNSGRILFVDNGNQVTTWIDPRTGKSADGKTEEELGLLMESPPSPLSLMDVITVGSPVNIDSVISESSSSSIVTVTGPRHPHQMPMQEERLLPIGTSRKSAVNPHADEQMSKEDIIDRVWQVFGSSIDRECSNSGEQIPLIEEKVGTGKIQVVANIQKQDSFSSDTVSTKDQVVTTTECYVGHVTHIRNGSLRLTQQPVEHTEAPVKPNEKSGQDKIASTKKETKINTGGTKKRRRKTGATSGTTGEVTTAADSSSKTSSVCGRASKLGSKSAGGAYGTAQQSRMDSSASLYSSKDNPLMIKQSSLRVGEDVISERCTKCGMPKEEYSEDEIGQCITILGTFIHQEPSLVAPLLPEILLTVTRIARNTQYSWELDSFTFVPSNSRSIARQFIRCVLHQLNGNGIFSMIFHMDLHGSHRQKFFNTIVQCLLDFNELSPAVPVATFFQEMNDRKNLSSEFLELSLPNLACYLSCIPFEQVREWSSVFPACELFLRRLWTLSSGSNPKTSSSSENPMGKSTMSTKGRDQPSPEIIIKLSSQIGALFDIFCGVFRMAGVQNNRFVLEPISKLISHALQNCNVSFHHMVSVCHLCNKAFLKERDKFLITRTAVFELVQALKFKTIIPDTNFLMLANLVLQDAGGSVIEDIIGLSYQQTSGVFNTGACEVMRNHTNDVLDFLADVHTLSKVKSMVKGLTIGVNEDTLGSILKASVAQFIALEITKNNMTSPGPAAAMARDSRKVLPWLYSPPANTAAQGPREFLDCVAHIRLLSWLLLGSVNHTLQYGLNDENISQPIPLEASCHIADHIQVILAGFAELSKTSVVHMCSLFHAFILCQLWTVYLEQIIALQVITPSSGNRASDEQILLPGSILLDFWGKVTPGILQLVSHSKVLAEMVNLHFLGLLEALMECHSTILVKLLPLWTPVLFAFHAQLPDHVKVRLQAIQDYKPSDIAEPSKTKPSNNEFLLKWLQRMQFKMGQIEMQASNVTQFFTV